MPLLHSSPDAHALQVAPPAPHDPLPSLARGSHVPTAVQHPEHEPPPQVHAPLEQLCPLPQAAHVAPFVPQEPLVCAEYASHVPAAVQHPMEHDAASQMHCPAALQAWPFAQELQVAPLVPQDPNDCAE